MPFRKAHALVGGLVRDSIERHVPLAELVQAHPDLGDAGAELLEPGVAVTRRTTPGRRRAGPGGRAAGAVHPPPRGRPGAPRASSAGERHHAERRRPGDRPRAARLAAGAGSTAASTATRSRWPRGCSTSCSSAGERVGPDRRGGGLPGGGGPGLPRLPGTDRAQRDDVRAAPGTCTCTSPTACTGAPTWSAGPTASAAGGPPAGGGAGRRARGDAGRPTGGPAGAGPVQRAGQAVPGPRGDRAIRRHRPVTGRRAPAGRRRHPAAGGPGERGHGSASRLEPTCPGAGGCPGMHMSRGGARLLERTAPDGHRPVGVSQARMPGGPQ